MSDAIPVVSKAVFDTHAYVRGKVEAASWAVYEAAKAAHEYQDPLAAAMFGVDEAVFAALATASKARITTLIMTGVPLFALRPNPEFFAALNGPGGADAAFRVLLESFSTKLPIASL